MPLHITNPMNEVFDRTAFLSVIIWKDSCMTAVIAAAAAAAAGVVPAELSLLPLWAAQRELDAAAASRPAAHEPVSAGTEDVSGRQCQQQHSLAKEPTLQLCKHPHKQQPPHASGTVASTARIGGAGGRFSVCNAGLSDAEDAPAASAGCSGNTLQDASLSSTWTQPAEQRSRSGPAVEVAVTAPPVARPSGGSRQQLLVEQQPPQAARMAEFVAPAADAGVPKQLARSMALGLRPSATPRAGRHISKRQNSEVRQIRS